MHFLLILKISTAVTLRTTVKILITDFNKSVYRYVCPISHMELVMPPTAHAHPFQHAKTTYQQPHTNYLNTQTRSLYMGCEKNMGSD